MWDPRIVFERFSDETRRVLVLAQEEGRLLNHHFIGTEHLLLGILHQGESVAAEALADFDVTLDVARQGVEAILDLGEAPPTGAPPFTPRAKVVMELAVREALQFDHDYVGPEHLLLGVIGEGRGVAAQVLIGMGVYFVALRRDVVERFGGSADIRPAHINRSEATWPQPEPPPLPDFDSMPPGVRQDLDTRMQIVPFDRVHRLADYWALRSIEQEHIIKLARHFDLAPAQQESVEAWWLKEIDDRLDDPLRRLGSHLLAVNHRGRRRYGRSKVLFQLWFNTLGPGGRTWFQNRYTPIRRYSFRIHWRP